MTTPQSARMADSSPDKGSLDLPLHIVISKTKENLK